jgi:hypothetical protein
MRTIHLAYALHNQFRIVAVTKALDTLVLAATLVKDHESRAGLVKVL